MTPHEYAVSIEKNLRPFTEAADGISFTDVTTVYESACLGGYPVQSEDYEKVKSYYKSFFKSARRKVGNFKWVWKFWRI